MANSQAKLMYPGLAGFYDSMLPIAETFVRIVVGIMFLMHVSGKFNVGPSGVAANVLAIEMLVALLVVHLPKGYAASGGGYEYVLLIGAACLLIAIRGGGPYSVDAMIGKEL